MLMLPRFGSGGASKVACVLASELSARGLSVSMATLGAAEGVCRAHLCDRVPIQALPDGGAKGRGLRPALAALPALVRAIRAQRPAVLMSVGNHANLMTAIAHRLAGVRETRLAVKITNPILREGRGEARRMLKTAVYRWIFRQAAAVLVLSPDDRAQAMALDPSTADRIRVVSNPYLHRHAVASPEALAAARPPAVLAVGRLTEQKNLELLLDALARLPDRPWRLTVLGDGMRRAGLQARAERLGIADRVQFLGYVADPGPHYRQAKVLAISSRWEALPAVAIEAMAAGCAVISTDCSPSLSRLLRTSGAGVVVRTCPTAMSQALDEALSRTGSQAPPDLIFDYTYEGAALSHHQALAELLVR
jgi:glycosyltransferase involved in cell wall biosynthesis